MADLLENSVGVVASVADVDLNAVAATTLYTVPASKKFAPMFAVLRDLSDDAVNAEISFGQSGDKDDWTKRFLLGTHLDATDDFMVIRPKQWLQASDTWNPASIANGAEEAKEVTCTDAEQGDFVIASFSVDVADLVLNAQVTAADTVTCVLANNTGGAIDLASGTIRVRVFKYNDGSIEYPAATNFVIDVTTAASAACTADVALYGTLLSA